MAGYDGFSMSNNALSAYADGLVPASKTGVPAHLVEIYVRPVEWHHTSAKFNATNFYDRAEVRAVFGLEPSEDYEADPAAVAALAKAKAAPKSRTVVARKIEWLEWPGNVGRYGRKAPPIEHRAENVEVKLHGQIAEFIADGQTWRKKIGANGFSMTEAS